MSRDRKESSKPMKRLFLKSVLRGWGNNSTTGKTHGHRTSQPGFHPLNPKWFPELEPEVSPEHRQM